MQARCEFYVVRPAAALLVHRQHGGGGGVGRRRIIADGATVTVGVAVQQPQRPRRHQAARIVASDDDGTAAPLTPFAICRTENQVRQPRCLRSVYFSLWCSMHGALTRRAHPLYDRDGERNTKRCASYVSLRTKTLQTMFFNFQEL
jgi:hypothetical protein